MPQIDDKTVIGYCAVHLSQGFLCQGEACIIADTEAAMQTYLKTLTTRATKFQIKPVNINNLIKGLDSGVLYALDQQVYDRAHAMAEANNLVFNKQKGNTINKRFGFVLVNGEQQCQ